MSRRGEGSRRSAPVNRDAQGSTGRGLLERSGTVAAFLLLLALGVRVLAAWDIPALTYDGAFYLRQAARILRGSYVFGGFPPGLPLPVALLGALGMDLELAARSINLLAGVAAVGIFFYLARRFVGARAAFLLGLLLAVHPVFVRVQVEVWSEPLTILTTLSAFLLYERRRNFWCGVLLGYAFLLRPESLVLLLGLSLVHFVQHRRVPWSMLLVGLVPVVAFSALSSRELGTFVISAKQGQWDLGSAVWGRAATLFETLHLVFPLLLVPFAVYEGVRRRSFLLLPTLYLAALPLYDIHIQQRIHLPAVVFLALLATMWLVRQPPAVRRVVLVLSLGLLVWGAVPSVKSFFEPSIMIEHSRDIGEDFEPFVEFDDAIAGRFPFIPYYAGAGFVRLENLDYAALMDSIQAAGATHLLILENEVVNIRPQLRALFDSDAFVRAESRLNLLHKIDTYPYERALLYALQPAPIPGDDAGLHGIVQATWLHQAWVGVDRQGRMVAQPESPNEPLIANWEAHSGAALREIAVSPGTQQVAFLQTDGQLHVLEVRKSTWNIVRMDIQEDPHQLRWIDPRTLLYLDGDGDIHALDTQQGSSFSVVVAGIPPDLPATALATRSEGGGDLAITYRRPTADRPLQRAIATVRWPESPPQEAAALELEVRWGTLVQLHDDRVSWVPRSDRLVISQAILQYDNDELVRTYGSLSVIQADGQTRHLTFDDPDVRAPQLQGFTEASRVSVLYLGAGDLLHWVDIPPEEFVVPEVTVFRDPQLRPGRLPR